MGCKTSVVRSDGSVTTFTQEDHHRAASPSASPSKLKPTRISSQTTAGPTSEATQEGHSGAQEAISAGRRKSSRASLPTSPRRSSADAAATSPSPLQHPPQPTTYAQDDDPFAPPPPLLPEAAEKSDSALTAHRGSSSSDSSSSSSDSIRAGGDDGHYRSSSSSGGRQAGLTENHFDPIPMPNPAQCGNRAAEAADLHHPRLPSAESRTVSKDSTGTFRTAISDHDKTDSAQAAKEYQQRMEAKRRAEEVHTKRRRLEEFDPVRPLDSFNVTHRGLLGRCWDRRAPELIPVSFVHAIAKALGVDESHPASTTTVSHVSGGDEFPPGSPIQHPSRLSRQSGPRASSVPPGPTWTGIGGRRVPRRSHWFSVGGISTDGLNPTKTSSPTSAEPFYVSSVTTSPTVPRAPPPLVFPTNAVPILLAGGPAIRTGAMQMMIAANASVHEQAKPSPKKAGAAKKDAAGGLESGSFAVKTLTPEQVSALPWETRESYYSVMLTRNPRFMGIKDHFAFKLGSGVSNDRSVKFLRKRNLEPAPGVTAMRWNRVEFFNPSLHTLVRAVAKTQGASVELQRIEAASCHTAGCNNDNNNNNNSTTGVAAAPNEANGSVVGLYSGCGSPRNRAASAAAAATAAGAVRTSPSAAALAEAERDGVVTASPEILHRSFSQCVIGEMENRSFARDNNGGGGSANGSFLNNTLNTNPIGGPPQGERSASGGRLDKAAEHGFTRGPGSFLMGLHRSQNKEVESCEGASAALTFPEDSVLALALGLPCSRLGQLAGVPAAVRNAALTSTGRLSSTFLFPAASTVGLGSRKASRDTLNSTTNGGGGGSSAAGGAAFTALRPNADSVLVSLNISCFSVSINPFEWQERHYTRYPVDIDGSKRSARSAYGEGVVTDVMYGGLMVVECSSLQAERELQALLASMAWTEERSLQGIVKDVRKHLKTVQTNLHKARAAGKTTGGAASEDTTRDWSAHRYRITRRIGGRPMRDAVELQDIRVFFSEDETMREERTTLHHPEQRRRTPVATAQSPTMPTAAKEQEGGTKTPGEERAAASHSSPNAPDPDVSSSFSRVASAWFGLPVISAVLRTWGLHLLACPEYAQPISMFLQKHAGLAPALQLTALGSFYHEGNTPSDDGDGAHDLDSFFFETDGPAYDDDKRGGAHDAHHHPQPARRIPKYNRFYASLPPSPASHQADDHPHERDGVSRDGNGGHRIGAAVGDGTGSGLHDEKGRAGQRRTGSSNSRPPRKDAPTAASSPVNHKSSSTALDEMAEAEAQHGHRHQQQHHRRRPRDAAQGDKEEDRESHHSLGPKSHSKETVEGEGAMHLLESRSSTFPPPTSATAGGSQNSTGLLSASQSSGKAVGGRPQQPQTSHATKKPPPLQVASSTRSGGTPQARKTSTATRPASRCDSPLSPGRMTVPHSRRNNDERTRHGRRSLASSASSSTSSSGSSFFESSSSGKTRHNTFVYQRNNSSSTGGAASVELSSHCPSRLERETTAVLVPEEGSALSRTSATEAARHVDVPTTTDGVLSPHVRRPPLSISNNSASPNTTPLFKGGSPHLFVPSSPGISSVDTLRQDTAYELVAMAKTVGPADSVAAKEAQRRTLSRMRDGESPLPSQGAVGSGSSPLTPASRRGSNAGSRGAPGEASPLSSSQATAAPAAAGSPASTSEGRREGKTKSKGTTTTKTKKTKKVKKPAEAAPLPPALKPSATTVEETRTTSAATAAIAAAGTDPTSLPIAPSAGTCDVKEAQIRPLGTPTGVAHASAFPPLNSSSSLATTAATTTTTTASLHPAGGHHATQEEAEGLWYMTMLEVKAQQQELEDLRRARRNAEDHRQRRQDDLRSLNRVFLPHTHPQDLDCTLLYLKTVLHEPDDIPHGRLFLQQLDWLPVLAAVWTSPANRIRSVEVAAELTWMDIPRLGVMTGLLYHHNAAGPLEELILRSDKLLGAPRCGLDDATDALAKTKRRKLLRKKKLADSMELSNTSLNFVTELDRTGTGFGPGCPPFFIAPEEARDTLWLLLCAVATNTVAANFRVVLRGIPTLESTGTGGSSSGSLDHDHNNRSASNAFTNFFAARRRDDRNEERLLLKPASMLLDSFVVQPTLHTGEESGSHIRVGGGLFKAASPPPSSAKSGGGGASAPPLQLVSRNSTFDEAGFLATAAGSIRLESPGRPTTSANTPEQPSPNTSRQPSSLVIVTSSPVGTAASPDPLGLDDGSGPYSPGRHTRRSLSTLMTLRTHAAAGAAAGSSVGRATPPPAKAHTVTVPTHQHHVKKRPWACDSIEVEERPFYEVLTHRCRPIEEARAAAANLDDPSLLSSLYVSHYHHPFNATHNDARFFIAPARQAQLQKAVRRAAAVANGEDFPEEVDESTAVYSSKVALTGARQLHLHPPQEDDEQPREQPQSTRGTTPSSPPPPPPPPVPCPPPLLFCETSVVFGLESAEEEARVLCYEEGQLRERAADIWEALRKSVKHYNQAQQETRHKAAKAATKGASAAALPPTRLITLEY